jgi:hypothetical protein
VAAPGLRFVGRPPGPARLHDRERSDDQAGGKIRFRRFHARADSSPSRSARSRCADLGVHHQPIRAFTFARNPQLVEATGARLVFLPGYSPDFNPIEHAWSKLKALLRKVGARTLRKLRNALRWALLEISSNDALGYFSHCGFRVPCQ